jgi:ubiquinone/menaquinone biosynthesis C-methylase UbiE
VTETYSDFSNVCSKFYDLIIDPVKVAKFVYSKVRDFQPKHCLFLGGFFLVVRELQKLGLDFVITDYTDEMVREGKLRLPDTQIERADLRELPYKKQFDAVFAVGRVFTHMLSVEDSSSALQSIYRSLKAGGVVFVDNYEDSKILVTDYFNGRVIVSDSSTEIIRNSSTELISSSPMIVNWTADYQVTSGDSSTSYHDEMQHRAFSREEMQRLLEEHGFEVHLQGDNFDDTSIFTVAVRKN